MKLNYQEKKSVAVNESVEVNLTAGLLKEIMSKVDLRIKSINEDKNLTVEEKTKRIESVTVESFTKRLIQDIHNAIISTVLLSDKSLEINGKLINTDKKRINGKSIISDIIAFTPEINEYLLTGRVTIDGKKLMIRNTQYIIRIEEKSTICHEFIDIKSFNSLNKADKLSIGKSKFFKFKGYIINQ